METRHKILVSTGLLAGSLMLIWGTVRAQEGLYIQFLRSYVQEEILSGRQIDLDDLLPIEQLNLFDFALRSQSRYVQANDLLKSRYEEAREELENALELLKLMTLMTDETADVEKLEILLSGKNSSERDREIEETYGVKAQSLISLFHGLDQIVVGTDLESLLGAAAPENPEVSSAPLDILSLGTTVRFVNLYEGGVNLVPYGQRVYKTRFAGSEIRYIWWELNLSHPAPGQRIDFSIDAVWYKPDESIFGKQTKKSYLNETWKSSWHTEGMGWDSPGNWMSGTYTVDLFIQGRKLATSSFEVY